MQPGLKCQQRLGRCFCNANSCRALYRVFPAREPRPGGSSVSQASLCGMRPQGTIEECQARIVSQKLGVQGCFCRKAHCLLNFCLQGVGGWGLRRASRREVRTLRRFRKDRGVQFFRGRRTLCFAGGRSARPERGLRPERTSQRRKRLRWEREPRAVSAPRVGQHPQG